MIFGDSADFAIEAMIEPTLVPPSSVWGRMCVWCRGQALGDIADPHCALYPAAWQFRALPYRLDDLWADEFGGLDDDAIWNFLDGKLYGYHGLVEVPDDRTVAECRADRDAWGGFDFLNNWGEPFDPVKAFLLAPPDGSARILFRQAPDRATLGRLVASRAAIVAASAGFVAWFDEQADRHGGG